MVWSNDSHTASDARRHVIIMHTWITIFEIASNVEELDDAVENVGYTGVRGFEASIY